MNAVCASPKSSHWDAALGIWDTWSEEVSLGITFQTERVGGVSLQAFAHDADCCASKGADMLSVPGGLVAYGGDRVSVVILAYAEVCHAVYNRSRIRGYRRRRQGGVVLEEGLDFHAAGGWSISHPYL